jgi:hypothetical protein
VEVEAGAGPDGCELEEDKEEPVLEPRDAVGVPLAAAAAGGDGSISFLSSSIDRFVGLVGLVGGGNWDRGVCYTGGRGGSKFEAAGATASASNGRLGQASRGRGYCRKQIRGGWDDGTG